jgi:transposase-like protein
MPTERIAMRRVSEILRLNRDAGLATREVARRTGVAPSTLREMFRRFERSGLAWPLPLDMADAGSGDAALRRGRHQARPPPTRWSPDWAAPALASRPREKLAAIKGIDPVQTDTLAMDFYGVPVEDRGDHNDRGGEGRNGDEHQEK